MFKNVGSNKFWIPKSVGSSLVKVGVVLAEMFQYTEIGTYVAGTNVSKTNVPKTVADPCRWYTQPILKVWISFEQ